MAKKSSKKKGSGGFAGMTPANKGKTCSRMGAITMPDGSRRKVCREFGGRRKAGK